jgi:hypothetical protein
MVGNKHSFQKLKSIPTAYDDANNNEEEDYVYEQIAEGKKLKCLQKTQWFLHFGESHCTLHISQKIIA